MNIEKKVKCVHCETVIAKDGTCACKKVSMIGGTIIEGTFGKDYVDISAVLLNENINT